MGKRILLMAGNTRAVFKWGLVGEVTKRLLEDPENEVFYVDCNGSIKGYCGLNHKRHWFYCKKCSPVCLSIVKLAGLADDHVLKMEKFKAPKFPKFESIPEAIDFDYEGYNYGLGPVSCIMTITRDYAFDIKKWQKPLHNFLNTEYVIFKNLEKFHEKYNFDEIHTFNGRMPSMYPCVSFAKKHNIPYVVYERGANINKLRTIPNGVPHDFDVFKNDIKLYWDKGGDDRVELAKKWFENRRGGKYQAIQSFTKDQIKNLQPADFDESKENFAYFNSSIDEVFAFKKWQHPFAENENELIKMMLEHYKDDDSKHFYLRIHPNLTRAKKKNATQMRELNALKGQYKNLTVIDPDEKIDTYALMDACDKTLVTYSTAGCEATYWGNVSILAGKSPYEDCDCAYKANSMEELYKLIDNKDLAPKPRENAYPYGYRNQVYGEDYKYFHAENHHEGNFMGMILKEKNK